MSLSEVVDRARDSIGDYLETGHYGVSGDALRDAMDELLNHIDIVQSMLEYRVALHSRQAANGMSGGGVQNDKQQILAAMESVVANPPGSSALVRWIGAMISQAERCSGRQEA